MKLFIQLSDTVDTVTYMQISLYVILTFVCCSHTFNHTNATKEPAVHYGLKNSESNFESHGLQGISVVPPLYSPPHLKLTINSLWIELAIQRHRSRVLALVVPSHSLNVPESMLTYHQICSVAFTWNYIKGSCNPWYMFVHCIFKIINTPPRARWVNESRLKYI